MLKMALMLPLAAFALAPAAAEEKWFPDCPVPEGVLVASWEKDAPPAVVKALKKQRGYGDISPPGGPFNPLDVSDEKTEWAPMSRVVFVWHSGGRWVVAAEHGGYGYYNPIFAFDLSADGQNAVLAAQSDVQPSVLCAMALYLLNDPPKPR